MTVALGRFIAPDVTAESFRNAFGGGSNHERPQCKERNIVCINKEAQPYAPHSVGESGLVFTFPDGIARCEDTNETFHLFLNMNPKLSRSTRQIRYLGTYTKVPIVHATVEPHEWQGLPSKVNGIFSPPLCVRLFLMAHCRLVIAGHIVFVLRQELVCVKHTQGSPYANRVGVGSNLQKMPFASGLNKIQRNRRGSHKLKLQLHSVLVNWWVSEICLPSRK